jgi:hypothetical protein
MYYNNYLSFLLNKKIKIFIILLIILFKISDKQNGIDACFLEIHMYVWRVYISESVGMRRT